MASSKGPLSRQITARPPSTSRTSAFTEPAAISSPTPSYPAAWEAVLADGAPPVLGSQTAGYPMAEQGSNKSNERGGGDGDKVTSWSADEYGSQSGGESGSEGSLSTRDKGPEPQDAAGKRSVEGETSQVPPPQNSAAATESSYSVRQRTVSKLPVSAPGRATAPSPAFNLNVGMEIWNASYVGTAPKVKPNLANVASGTVGANRVGIEHHRIQDEREMKRERRTQSNRESARRSRLRKQQECEDLAREVNELNSENSALKVELEQLKKGCEDLKAAKAATTLSQETTFREVTDLETALSP
ncbi:DNA-binding protein EMBP-1-like isoform X2 [Asparagus officinalis]|uniref:DNA-binding protein EMBP-1-like isoform X2 n=1 Tax=Asparagus officinalis TaxID=4686 RepID=UPI00098E578B|nr:DNA-binding protein EMBP-1-like isoform X2 [Asparagus officinalis]